MSFNFNAKAATKQGVKDLVVERVRESGQVPAVAVLVMNAAIDLLPDSEEHDVFMTTHGHMDTDADGKVVVNGLPNLSLSVQLTPR